MSRSVSAPPTTHVNMTLVKLYVARSKAIDRAMRTLATAATGVMAGFFWSFSFVVMPGLAEAEPLAAMDAMQSINEVVRNPVFFLGFFGTPAICVLTAISALARFSRPRSWLVLAASLVYLIGVFGVTVAFNIPLNEDLARLDPTQPANAPAMTTYIADWNVWNDIRTYAGLISCALFGSTLLQRRSESD